MSETKTYVFGNDGQCGGGMMSLLAPLLQRNGLDPNLLLAMNKNGNGWGDGSGFMWVIFLFFLMGWGGNGWGGFGGNGRGAIANEINNDYGRSLLMDAIGGNRNALSNLATQLNCTEGQIQSAISALTSQVQSVGNQVGMSSMQTINALQQGNMQIAQQLADCCCRTNNAITAMDGNVKLAMCQQTGALTNSINNVAVGQERGFANVAYETQRQTCDLQNAIKDSTQTIVNGQQQAVIRSPLKMPASLCPSPSPTLLSPIPMSLSTAPLSFSVPLLLPLSSSIPSPTNFSTPSATYPIITVFLSIQNPLAISSVLSRKPLIPSHAIIFIKKSTKENQSLVLFFLTSQTTGLSPRCLLTL